MIENKNKEPLTEKIDIKINKITPDQNKKMASRLIVAAVLIPPILVCIFLGDFFLMGLIFVASLIACHEIIKAPQALNNKYKSVIYVFAYIMMISLTFWIFLKNNLITYSQLKADGLQETFKLSPLNNLSVPSVSLIAFTLCMGFFFLMDIIDPNFTILESFYFIVMLFVVSFGLQCILYLRFLPFKDAGLTMDTATNGFKFFESSLLLIVVLTGALICDAGAYFFGIFFGKHKLAPLISPKKTVEGFIGGVFTSVVVCGAILIISAALGHPLLKCLDLAHWYNILILCICMPIFSTIGDLVFSSIKRRFEIKDFGTILKAHGGVLDRIDSVIFTSLGSTMLLIMMSANWGFLN